MSPVPAPVWRKKPQTTNKDVPNHVRHHARNHISDTDLENYIVFSNRTKGTNGRKMLIDSKLLAVFLSVVDPVSHEGIQAIGKIENLRAMAGLTGSYKSQDAFEHMVIY